MRHFSVTPAMPDPAPLEKQDLYRSPERRRTPLLLRGVVLLGLFWLMSKAITPWTGLYDWQWAFPELGKKVTHLAEMERQANVPNAFVAGSSVVLHHVVPTVLDSCTAAANERDGAETAGLTWYNWGVQRAVPPESFQLAHELLDELPAGACEVLVVDVLPSEPLLSEESGALRQARAMDFPEMWRRLKLLPWEEPEMQDVCWGQTQLLLATWLQHLVGFLRARHWLHESPPFPDSRKERGFVALQPADLLTGRLRASREAFLAHPDSLTAHNRAIAQDFDLRLTLPDPTIHWDCAGQVRPVLDQMTALKARCDAADIRLIFVFQKLWGANGCIYFEALDKWGDCHVLQFMGEAAAPSLFTATDAYDNGHFLPSGARKYSRHLGRAIHKTLTDCPEP